MGGFIIIAFLVCLDTDSTFIIHDSLGTVSRKCLSTILKYLPERKLIPMPKNIRRYYEFIKIACARLFDLIIL